MRMGACAAEVWRVNLLTGRGSACDAGDNPAGHWYVQRRQGRRVLFCSPRRRRLAGSIPGAVAASRAPILIETPA
jgi:hypothetical protein